MGKKIESEIENGLYFHSTEAENTTLLEALERYAREVTSEKKSAYAELARIKIWQKNELAPCFLTAIRGKDLAAYRDWLMVKRQTLYGWNLPSFPISIQ